VWGRGGGGRERGGRKGLGVGRVRGAGMKGDKRGWGWGGGEWGGEGGGGNGGYGWGEGERRGRRR